MSLAAVSPELSEQSAGPTCKRRLFRAGAALIGLHLSQVKIRTSDEDGSVAHYVKTMHRSPPQRNEGEPARRPVGPFPLCSSGERGIDSLFPLQR
jgi:hypothetical protein